MIYPLKVSENNRYFVDQEGNPYLVFADTGWMLFSYISKEDAKFYIEERFKQGINSILCYATPFKIDRANTEGNKPFLNEDILTPNEKYFANVDWIINKAVEYGMQVIICPAEMDNYKSYFTLENAMESGRYMGNRYKDFANIMWFVGGDLNPTETEMAVANALISGLREYDSNHIISFHPRGAVSKKYFYQEMQDIEYRMVHVHSPSSHLNYSLITEDYELEPTMPTILAEPCYEDDEQNTNFQIRMACLWGFLSGAAGIAYGNLIVYNFGVNETIDWKPYLDHPALLQIKNFVDLIGSREWAKLVPSNDLIIEGRGTLGELDYGVAQIAFDGSFAVCYIPTSREIKIDMSLFDSGKTICWFDPTKIEFKVVNQYPNTGILVLPAQPKNAEEQHDWVLIIE
ncbi:MAG: DUF4038 domain-containing protein [Clostridia bacterium]|jgi:hypothetical protein